MARFQFKALDAEKKEESGVLEASDRDAALKLLSRRFELVTEVTEVKPRRGLFAGGISTEEVMVVTQQLAVMLEAGMPLKHSLGLVDSENPAMEDLMASISSGVSEGRPMADLFGEHPRVFSRLYCSMVRAGEASGKLPTILMKLAEYLESAEGLRRKVKGALVYPTAVIGVAFLIAAFIFIFGVKQFQDIYAGLNMQLPPATRLVIGVANFLESWWLALILAAVALAYALRRWLETGPGQLMKDQMVLKVPVLGPLMRRLAIAHFCRTLSTLQAGGVPILASLDLVASSMGNRVMEDVVRNAVKDVEEGAPLVGALRKSGVFTRMSLSMISTGEESGTMDRMLDRVATFYETQAEAMLKSMISLLEPAVILGVGVFVAILIVALGMPMLNLVQHLG